MTLSVLVCHTFDFKYHSNIFLLTWWDKQSMEILIHDEKNRKTLPYFFFQEELAINNNEASVCQVP